MSDLTLNIKELVVAVRDVEAAAKRYGDSLGVDVDAAVSYPQSGIEIDMTGVWVGDFRIAFVTDSSGSGHVSRFIDKRGEGPYELCLRTNDLSAAIEQLKQGGMQFVSEEPHILRDYEWRGEIFSEVHVVFVNPATSHGMLIELQQWFK